MRRNEKEHLATHHVSFMNKSEAETLKKKYYLFRIKTFTLFYYVQRRKEKENK